MAGFLSAWGTFLALRGEGRLRQRLRFCSGVAFTQLLQAAGVQAGHGPGCAAHVLGNLRQRLAMKPLKDQCLTLPLVQLG